MAVSASSRTHAADPYAHVETMHIFSDDSATPIREISGDVKRGSVIELWRMPKLRTIFIAGGITSSARDLAQFYFPIYGHSLGRCRKFKRLI